MKPVLMMKVALLLTAFAAATPFAACKKQLLPGKAETLSPITRSVVPNAASQNKLRVFGYFYRADNAFSQYMDSLDLTQLTDIALSFVNPDNEGQFTIGSNVSDAVVKGHNANVRMYFSFGGGNSATFFDTLLYPQNRTAFIVNLRNVAVQHNFDGIDVDLEGDRVTSNYNAFIMQLADTLHKYSKKLTISISTWKGAIVSNAAYAKVDYINSQSYGGPPENGSTGSRAPYSDFVSDFQYFNTTRGIPASKFNGGVPFYGDNFTNGVSSGTISYKQLLSQVSYAYRLNYKYLDPYKVSYFDGHPAMKKKVEYALQQKMGGIMIWQISFDTKDERSLLRVINRTASTGAFDSTQTYQFINKNSNKPMEVANASLVAGTNILQGTQAAADARLWKITAGDGGSYKLVNKNSSLVAALTSADGAPLQQWAWSNLNSQQFKLTSNSLGFYTLTNVATNKVVEVAGASTADGASIIQKASNGGNSQQWILAP